MFPVWIGLIVLLLFGCSGTERPSRPEDNESETGIGDGGTDTDSDLPAPNMIDEWHLNAQAVYSLAFRRGGFSYILVESVVDDIHCYVPTISA